MTITNSSPSNPSQSAVADKAAADAEKLKNTAKVKADEAVTHAKAKASEAVDSAKAEADNQLNEASKSVDDLSQVIDAAAETLSDQDREGLASYARQLSGNIGELADNLQAKSIDDLARDAKALASNNPNAFLLGSIALGFGLSRFAKASGTRATASASKPDSSVDFGTTTGTAAADPSLTHHEPLVAGTTETAAGKPVSTKPASSTTQTPRTPL